MAELRCSYGVCRNKVAWTGTLPSEDEEHVYEFAACTEHFLVIRAKYRVAQEELEQGRQLPYDIGVSNWLRM